MSASQVVRGHKEQTGRTNGLKVKLLSNSTSMVFGNLDIMEMVFTAFSDGANGNEINKRFLLRAALTSKDFCYPAMNVLWRSLDFLSPILNLIPNPKKRLSWMAENQDLSAMDEVSEKDLISQRADQYRRRVRHLTLHPDGYPDAVADYIYLFNRLPSNFRLFPCLQSFSCFGLDKFKWELLQILFRIPSPTLSGVTFFGIDNGSRIPVETFLTRLSRMKSESLLSLRMEGKLTAKSHRVLQQFSNLSSLYLGLDDIEGSMKDLLKDVLRVVNLRDLTLACWCNEFGDSAVRSAALSTLSPKDIPLLDKLEMLKIIGNLAFMHAVVGAIFEHIPNLKVLSVEIVSGEKSLPETTERCIMDATTHTPLVESFVLNVETDIDPGLFHWNAVRHIRKWKLLKRLHVIARSVVVDDDANFPSGHIPMLLNGLNLLEHLTLDIRSWGKLEHGKLNPATKHMFLSLPQIAESCPKLSSLDIFIPFMIDPAELEIMERALIPDIHGGPERAGSSTGVPHRLERLTFRKLFNFLQHASHKPSIESANIVGRYLAIVFPQLQYVDFTGIVGAVGKNWCNTVASITGAHNVLGVSQKKKKRSGAW